jgi:hypothetical protein
MRDWIGTSQGICIDGVNSAMRPSHIGDRQVAWMVNGSVRGGQPRTRPGFTQRLVLPSGKVQGAGFFSINRGKIILSISGRLHRVSIAGNAFSHDEIVLPWRNSAALDTAWMQETVGNFIVQDGQSAAIIYNGSDARRSDIFGGEVPLGRMMAFGNGRLWVVTSRYNVKAGDIYSGPNTELKFTETQFLLGGGSFSFPQRVTALAFLPVNNTATGYGSLMVYGRNRLDSIRAEIAARDLWQAIPGFVTQVLDEVGTLSHACVTAVNQDLYWRDANGEVRSLRSAAQEAASPGNTGMSREVARITDHETDAWLDQSSGLFFDNRLFFTASPFRLPSGAIGFKKLISLDCAPLASMRGKAQPAYDGEWTGASIVRLVGGRFDGRHRAFAVVQDNAGENSLWEFTPQVREDAYLDGGDVVRVPIRSAVEFRQFDFGAPSQPKKLTRCDVYPASIEGEVNVSIYWRVANRNQWRLWGTFKACAKTTDAPAENPETPHAWKNLRSQERGRVKTLTIPDESDEVLGRSQSVGHAFQVRIVWTGSMELDRIDVWARPLRDIAFSTAGDLPDDFKESAVSDNEVSYTIKPT